MDVNPHDLFLPEEAFFLHGNRTNKGPHAHFVSLDVGIE
jgi:hypothetical protein